MEWYWILLTIFLVITTFAFYIVNAENKNKKPKPSINFCDAFWIVIVTGIMSVFIFIGVLFISPKTTDIKIRKIVPETYNDKFVLNGRFVAGSGEIKEELKYTAYLKHTNGNIVLHTFPASRVTIRYGDKKPLLIIEDHYSYSKWAKGSVWGSESFYTFLIPKGSLKMDGFDGQ